jgi:hypothetical protein
MDADDLSGARADVSSRGSHFGLDSKHRLAVYARSAAGNPRAGDAVVLYDN